MTEIRYSRENRETSSEAVALPGSKSMAARALVIHYVRDMKSQVRNLPDCDDTRELSAALRKLSSLVPSLPDRMNEKNPEQPEAAFNLGTGGTSLRFFTALAASVPGLVSTVNCSDALRKRPLAGLVEALRMAGARIEYIGKEGFPPMRIFGRRLPGDEVEMSGKVSSQFISAMLMVSELWEKPLSLRLEGGMVSRPYVEMTEKMLLNNKKDAFDIEPDWSAASYFYELALLSPGKPVRIGRLCDPKRSVQGDSAAAALFGRLGVETRLLPDGGAVLLGAVGRIEALASGGETVEFDLGDVPDLTPALAVGMCLAGIRFRFTNVAHLRQKECDRMAALQTNLGKLGYRLVCGDSTLEWKGERMPAVEAPVIESYADHRMAMAFSLAATKRDGVRIDDTACVSKSFPGFYNELPKLGFSAKEA